MMNLDQAIAQYEQFANVCKHHGLTASQEEFEQIATWLRELRERRREPGVIRCRECKHWKDSDGVYRRGICAESKCPVNSRQVYEGTFFCGMAEMRSE